MLRSSLLVLTLVFSAASYAEDFEYNYLDLSYGILDIDDINVDGDGFGLGGSFSISPNVHLFAGYQSSGLDFGIDANSLGIGIGYNTEISPTADVVARLSYQYAEVDIPAFGSVDDTGFGLGVGLRFAAGEKVELNAGINYVDFSDSGGETSFGLGGFYSVNEFFELGLSGSWSDDSSSYSIAGRFYFGQ